MGVVGTGGQVGGGGGAGNQQRQVSLDVLWKRSSQGVSQGVSSDAGRVARRDAGDMGKEEEEHVQLMAPDGYHGTGNDTNHQHSINTYNSRNNNVVKSVLDRQCVGSLCAWSERMLESKRVGLCRCVARDGFRSWDVLSSTNGNSFVFHRQRSGVQRHVGVFSCVEMDRVGELFVTGDDAGIVTVNYVSSTVRSLLKLGGEEKGGSMMSSLACEYGIDTALSIDTRGSGVSSVRWNPRNQNEIVVLDRAGAQTLKLYDINRTRGEPLRTLGVDQRVRGYFSGDVKYFGQGQQQQYCLAVGCSDGSVVLHDARTAKSQSTSMLRSGQLSSPITSLEIVDDGRLVLAGTSRDHIHVWDVRYMSGSAVTLSAVGANKHPLLHTVNIPYEMRQVPELLDQSGYIPPCTPRALHLDPETYHRVAFHLSSGWTGVLDMARMSMTHLHAPPTVSGDSVVQESLALDQAIAARRLGDSGRVALPHEVVPDGENVARRANGMPGGHVTTNHAQKVGCWRRGSQFVVPSRSKHAVFVVDFSSSSKCGTKIDNRLSSDDGPPSAVQISVPHEATCVLADDATDAILAFGTQGHCSLIID